MSTFEIIIVFLILVLGYFVIRPKKESNVSQENQIESKINLILDSKFGLFNQQINELSHQLNERLKENSQNSQHQGSEMRKSLEHATSAVSAITGEISKLQESNRHIFEISKDISSLQEILRAPKLRGGLGEQMLADILSQVVPKSNYVLQYAFSNEEKVDAVLKMNNFLLPIDSKFPLENFKKYIQSKEKAEKIALEKLLISDVKKHIDAISKKYILTDEGTTDFALMYIPAENVYYELFIRDEADKDLISYSFNKKVIPVSPNSFYAYLQAILLGLRGQQIEKGAKEILSYLSRLEREVSKFSDDFDKLGSHINHAKNSYDGAEKRFDKLEENIHKISAVNHEELPPIQELKE